MVVTDGRTGRRHGDGRRIMSRFVSLSHTPTWVGDVHEEKRCTHGAHTPVSFPTTPARVHDGSHFCTKKAAHVVIWHVYWLSTWWREDRLPRLNKQIAT